MSRSVPVEGRAWSRVNMVDAATGKVVGHSGFHEGGANVPPLGHALAFGPDGAVYRAGSQGLIKCECR